MVYTQNFFVDSVLISFIVYIIFVRIVEKGQYCKIAFFVAMKWDTSTCTDIQPRPWAPFGSNINVRKALRSGVKMNDKS